MDQFKRYLKESPMFQGNQMHKTAPTDTLKVYKSEIDCRFGSQLLACQSQQCNPCPCIVYIQSSV